MTALGFPASANGRGFFPFEEGCPSADMETAMRVAKLRSEAAIAELARKSPQCLAARRPFSESRG